MLAYIIQSDEGLYLGDLENIYVTTSKERAKQLIKDTLADNIYEITEEIEERMETFAQDLVDGNTRDHYSDEFEGVCVWCEIHGLIE